MYPLSFPIPSKARFLRFKDIYSIHIVTNDSFVINPSSDNGDSTTISVE